MTGGTNDGQINDPSLISDGFESFVETKGDSATDPSSAYPPSDGAGQKSSPNPYLGEIIQEIIGEIIESITSYGNESQVILEPVVADEISEDKPSLNTQAREVAMPVDGTSTNSDPVSIESLQLKSRKK